MKTLTILLTLFFGLALTSSSAPDQRPNEPLKRGFSVLGVWRYRGGEENPMEIHFLPNHKAIFKGGYEYYNPAEWYFNPATAELKLIVAKMKQRDFKLFNQWIGLGSLKKVNSKEKTIFYTLREGRICFMGYVYAKPGS